MAFSGDGSHCAVWSSVHPGRSGSVVSSVWAPLSRSMRRTRAVDASSTANRSSPSRTTPLRPRLCDSGWPVTVYDRSTVPAAE